MEQVRQVNEFFIMAANDDRFTTIHISLYMVLIRFWMLNEFQNPVSITRREVMRLSKIRSIATYHKCIREIQAAGLIRYEPSYNPFLGSRVHIENL